MDGVTDWGRLLTCLICLPRRVDLSSLYLYQDLWNAIWPLGSAWPSANIDSDRIISLSLRWPWQLSVRFLVFLCIRAYGVCLCLRMWVCACVSVCVCVCVLCRHGVSYLTDVGHWRGLASCWGAGHTRHTHTCMRNSDCILYLPVLSVLVWSTYC